MALRILLADDSMTAQNMGKKILSDGGYEVIAVSNGAAALKKIAEQKPDVVVLDIYMPGYSGLEVCERLKNTIETARVPVLLTVGKLEPFRPEDAVRVRAEGVIIKPFEATELLAVIEKAASHVVKAIPVAPKPAVEQFAEEADYAEQMGSSVAALEEIEVPKDVADAPAFGLDEMASAISTTASPADLMPSFESPEIEDYTSHTAAVEEETEAPTSVVAAEVPGEIEKHEPEVSVESHHEPEFELAGASAFTPSGGDPLLESRLDGGPVNPNLESELFIDNPDPGEVRVERDPNLWVDDSVVKVEPLPDLELTAHETPEPADAVADPGLIARENLMSEVEDFKYQDVEDDLVCESEAQVEAEPAAEAKPPVVEDDFDALVSAALAKFEPEEEAEQEPEPVAAVGTWRAEATALDQAERAVSLEREMQIAMAVASGASGGVNVSTIPVVAPPIFTGSNGNGAGTLEHAELPELGHRLAPVEEEPPQIEPVETAPELQGAPVEVEPEVPVVSEPESIAEPAPADPVEEVAEVTTVSEPEPQPSEPAVAATEAAIPGALLGQVVGQPKDPLEQERLVEAIGRVLERLKPQIVSELAKELKNKE